MGMLNVEYGLYVTLIGMGGVFVVLSILSMFMWCMGRLNVGSMKKTMKNESNKTLKKLNESELFAVISAINAYELEQNVIEIINSKTWKNVAKMEGLR